MIKRLVSAYYNSHYPFHDFPQFRGSVLSWTYSPEKLEKGDALIVWGGADISPSLYNHRVSKWTHAYDTPSERDRIEWNLMKQAAVLEIPIIGICRGAQMLCALAGGSLWQHVTGHGGSHEVTTDDGRLFRTNSIHHQMMNPEGTLHTVKAWTTHPRSEVYWNGEEAVRREGEIKEPEAILFPQVKGIAIQWHPEMMEEDCAATYYVRELVDETLGQ